MINLPVTRPVPLELSEKRVVSGLCPIVASLMVASSDSRKNGGYRRRVWDEAEVLVRAREAAKVHGAPDCPASPCRGSRLRSPTRTPSRGFPNCQEGREGHAGLVVRGWLQPDGRPLNPRTSRFCKRRSSYSRGHHTSPEKGGCACGLTIVAEDRDDLGQFVRRLDEPRDLHRVAEPLTNSVRF